MADSSLLVAVSLNEENQRILDALTHAEGRSRSDIMRRALRMYGERAGLVERRPKVKPVKVSSPMPRARKVKG